MNFNSTPHEQNMSRIIHMYALDSGLVGPGEILEVGVRVIKIPIVRVKIEGAEEGIDDPNSILVKDLEFSSVTSHFLEFASITMVGQLRNLTRDEILKICDNNKKCVAEIQAKLTEMGIFINWFSTDHPVIREMSS